MQWNYYPGTYGIYVGLGIRGAIGYLYTFQIIHGKQCRFPYYVPPPSRTYAQAQQRDKLKHATYSWHTLTEEQKNYYRGKEPITPIMSGFNFFVRQYIKAF